MDGKFLTKETKDNLIDLFDDLTTLGIWEVVERPAYSIILNQIDKYADKIVPDYLDAEINTVCNLIMDKQFDEAAIVAGEVIDSLVDIKRLTDEVEKLLFVDGLTFIVRQLQVIINRS